VNTHTHTRTHTHTSFDIPIAGCLQTSGAASDRWRGRRGRGERKEWRGGKRGERRVGDGRCGIGNAGFEENAF